MPTMSSQKLKATIRRWVQNESLPARRGRRSTRVGAAGRWSLEHRASWPFLASCESEELTELEWRVLTSGAPFKAASPGYLDRGAPAAVAFDGHEPALPVRAAGLPGRTVLYFRVPFQASFRLPMFEPRRQGTNDLQEHRPA
jgi:hypothetical protein